MFHALLFMLDYTAKKALERSKNCDVPFAWDDPTSKEDVKFIVQALFNQVCLNLVIGHSSDRGVAGPYLVIQ